MLECGRPETIFGIPLGKVPRDGPIDVALAEPGDIVGTLLIGICGGLAVDQNQAGESPRISEREIKRHERANRHPRQNHPIKAEIVDQFKRVPDQVRKRMRYIRTGEPSAVMRDGSITALCKVVDLRREHRRVHKRAVLENNSRAGTLLDKSREFIHVDQRALRNGRLKAAGALVRAISPATASSARTYGSIRSAPVGIVMPIVGKRN